MNKRILILIGLLAAAVLFFKIYFPVVSRYHGLKFQQEQNTRTIRDLEERIRLLREEKKLLQTDPEYIETTIRKEFGMVKPGEIVYKFVEDQPREVTPAEAVLPTPET